MELMDDASGATATAETATAATSIPETSIVKYAGAAVAIIAILLAGMHRSSATGVMKRTSSTQVIANTERWLSVGALCGRALPLASAVRLPVRKGQSRKTSLVTSGVREVLLFLLPLPSGEGRPSA
eukprot:769039-Prymnesium_polylepis.1